MKRFTAAGSRCRQNLKYENFTSSFDRPRQKFHQKEWRTCSTIIFPHSTNLIICLCRCRCRCCRHFLNSLLSAFEILWQLFMSLGGGVTCEWNRRRLIHGMYQCMFSWTWSCLNYLFKHFTKIAKCILEVVEPLSVLFWVCIMPLRL